MSARFEVMAPTVPEAPGPTTSAVDRVHMPDEFDRRPPDRTGRGSAGQGGVGGASVRLVREVLQGLLIATAVVWATCLLGVLWVRHRLRRRLRIAPDVRSAAPTLWLVSPRSAARLHHRLRRVGASARAASTLDPALTDLADDLLLEAVTLEPAVVTLARSGRTGASVRRRVSIRIGELEQVARQLTSLSAQGARGPSQAIGLRDRVDSLEAARQELAEIERAAGLVSRA
jgi:hypothetical protein